MKYKGLICGGVSNNLWDKEFEVEAESFIKAAQKALRETHTSDCDVVTMEQID